MELSAGSLIAMLFVSTIGFSFFLYGKKQARIPQFVAGLLMMVYPYFITDPLWMTTVAAAMLGGLWAAVRAGW